ncbi:MAG: hypothetical protein FWC64_11215 [Treponema sp.]|nr:hypothetical protein [Treponema sp.]
MAYVIGAMNQSYAFELYQKVKREVGEIKQIYTDGNYCYRQAFHETQKIPETHIVAKGKSQTHMIEATNSSIRDNLARFNRRTKRYSKSNEMLDCTLKLFFQRKSFGNSA